MYTDRLGDADRTISVLGRLPQPGDQVEVHGLRLEVLGVRHRDPECLRLQRNPDEPADGDARGSGTVDT